MVCNILFVMRSATLVFLLKDESFCLAMKKRGFGEGKWNGVGGKVLESESVEQAAIREISEEINVSVHTKDLEKVGELTFYYVDKPEWNQVVHVYTVRKWQGEVFESDEMRPRWYDKGNVPYNDMWVDDPLWLPRVLDSKKVVGTFHFIKQGSEIDRYELKEVDGFE